MSNKYIFLLILSCMYQLKINAYNITGKITDEKFAPIEFVNVVLLNSKDSSFVDGVVSDSEGRFSMPAHNGIENFTLSISYMGYKTTQLKIVSADLGNIVLHQEAKSLNEVVVRGHKPIIKREIDRLVFNVNNTPYQKGNTIMDLLRMTPLLKVTDNAISIIGKSNVRVMINGKISYLDSSDIIQYLKSLQSDDVISIEVITTPPAKYEAGGNGGMINIITRNRKDIGLDGNVGVSYTQRSYAGISSNASVNYRSAKSFLSFRVRQSKSQGTVDEAYQILQNGSGQSSETARKDTYDNIGGNMTFEHQLTPLATIGMVYDFNRGDDNLDIRNKYNYYSNSKLDSLLNTYSVQSGKTISHTLNLYYDLKLDSLGKKLGIAANYMSHTPDKDVNFTTLNEQTNNKYIVKEPNNIRYSIYTGEANLELPFKSFKLETGVKYSNVNNNSDMQYYNLRDNNYVADIKRCNVFNYKEQTLAGYLSAYKSINAHFSFQAGLRYEHTFVKGITPNNSSDNVKTDYGHIFPTIYFTYKPSELMDFHLNYARRINRPYFRALNPFRWYTNPNNVDQGNPALRPSFVDNFELGYVFKNNLAVTVYYQKENDAYGQSLNVSDDKTTYSTYDNIYNNRQFGVNLSYSLNPFEWWNISLAGNYIYNKSKIMKDDYIPQNGGSFDYKCCNTVSFDKDHRFQFFLNYSQNLAYKVGTTYDKSYANCSAGLKYALMHNNLVINLYTNDLFKQDLVKRETFAKTNTQIYNNYYDSRYLRLSVVYSWGKTKVKYQKKNISFNERNRL